MPTIAVVFHSGYGHTQRMAQAVAQGAGAELIAIDAEGNLPVGGWEQLKAADAIIFGTPTYMGSVSWQFKKFADASSKYWYAQEWKDKIAAGFTNSAGVNGDKQSTLTALFTMAMQHGMIWVSQGLMPSNTKDAKRNDVNYLVSFSGAIAQSPSDAGAGEMAAGDLETARLFGERVASVTARMAAGQPQHSTAAPA
ncbi:flavodoxin family protein [Variovorax sp. OV700]|uniref:flavodoxin family protein n=1 Tax=Variovorax sp. OV700 TaxID=1882826 RepID=UPI000887053B|nr:flavodoxin family protein [Variovorax sp. OV700]SDH78822.1 Multimeric flavodoxin WrbA [Variovorax sp. OV700]